jgi:hypothetical protein
MKLLSERGKRPPVHLGGMVLDDARHVCAFFHSKEEEYDVLMPFILEGFERGDKALHIVDPAQRTGHKNRLLKAGVDVRGAENRRQLEVLPWERAYVRGGCFNQDGMLKLLDRSLFSAKADGFPLTRLVANMEWAASDSPGVDDLIEYETRLNYILPKYDDAVTCTYDLDKFGASVVMDIMRTHPMAIIGGYLEENPFYVQPDQMLAELQQRQRNPH